MGITDLVSQLDSIPFFPQSGLDWRREAAIFYSNDVRYPLMVKPGRVHGFLNIKVQVNHI